MLKKLWAYLVLAISCAVEVYLLIPGGYDVFHGGVLHTFLGVLGTLFFPILGIYVMWFTFFRKNVKACNKSEEFKDEIENASKLSERRKEKYISRLETLKNFRKYAHTTEDQINRFEMYLSNIRTLYFSLSHKTKINTTESERVIEGAVGIFYRRIESMIACIDLFNCREYYNFMEGKLKFKSSKSMLEKKALFGKTFNQINEIIDSNEELILTVHKLLSALTEMGLSKEWDNETIIATKRLNDYIESAEGVTELNAEIGNEIMRLFDNN